MANAVQSDYPLAKTRGATEMNRLLAAIAALVLPAFASAHDYSAGALEIIHPMAFETAPAARAGGGYLTIVNTGEDGDALIEVRAGFPRVMLHRSEEENGIARMKHVDRIAIPAGETVALEPGGYHIMFMGLDGSPFESGNTFPATLVFESAGEVEVEFKIEARGGEAPDQSGHH